MSVLLFCLSAALAAACSASVDPPEPVAATSPPPAAPMPTMTAPPPGTDFLDVFILGDFGTGGPGQQQVAHVIQSSIADAPRTLLLTTGDNFYPAGVTSVDDPLWKTRVEDVYGDFGMPMYATLGNHDHRGNTQAQVDYTHKSALWKMPERYYAFTTNVSAKVSVRFVALDTTRLRQGDDAAQTRWLTDELSQRRADFTVVFGHHPLYSSGPHGDDPQLANIVAPLLKPVADIFVAGHDHILQVVGERDGVLHLVCGGGNGDDRPYPVTSAPGEFAMTGGGTMRLRFQPQNVDIGLIGDDGALRFTSSRPRRPRGAKAPVSGHPGAQSVRP